MSEQQKNLRLIGKLNVNAEVLGKSLERSMCFISELQEQIKALDFTKEIRGVMEYTPNETMIKFTFFTSK